MKKRIILFLSFSLFFMLNFVSSSTPGNISSCQIIDTSGSYYLNQSLTSYERGCFNITANDVYFDGQGNSITGTPGKFLVNNFQTFSLAIGAHGTIYVNGSFFLGSGSSGNFVKVNPYNVSDYTNFGLPGGVGQLTYVARNDRIYAITYGATVYEVDYINMNASTVISGDASGVQHSSITSDEDYLYIITADSNSRILKYNSTNFSLVQNATLTGLATGHAITYDNSTGFLYATGLAGYLAKINSTDLSYTYNSSYGTNPTDDITVAGDYVYLGDESNNNVIKINKSDISIYSNISIGCKSYGTFYDGVSVWNTCSDQQNIKIIDLTNDQVYTYSTGSWFPNELIFINNTAMVTHWNSPFYPKVFNIYRKSADINSYYGLSAYNTTNLTLFNISITGFNYSSFNCTESFGVGIKYSDIINLTRVNVTYSNNGLYLLNSSNSIFYNIGVVNNYFLDVLIDGSLSGINNIIGSLINSYQFTNILNISLENEYGGIRFLSEINGTGNKFIGNSNSDIAILNNSANINSSQIGINKSANITLYNIGERSYTYPTLLKNGALCNDCYNFTKLNDTNIVFNVTSAGNYSIAQLPTLPISCGTLNIANGIYILQNNISDRAGTCFNITADNITLDGNGYYIDGDDSGTDYGVYVAGFKNITIKNFVNITDFTYGIYLSSSHNNTILNNSLISNTNSGLYLTSSHNNKISNSSSSLNVYGLQIIGSNYNNFTEFIANSSTTRDLYQTGTAANYNYFVDSIFKKYSIATSSLLYFVNSTWGEIKFISGINGTGNDLISNRTSDIRFENNSVYVNSGVSGLSRGANITLYGIGNRGYNVSAMLKDGYICIDCSNFTSLNANNVLFNVSSWSNYSIGETSDSYFVSSCQTLSIAGARYVLQNNISNNAGTCFTVSADNITIDGNGYYIDGTDSGYGVYASGRRNITVVNLIIDDFQYGIYLLNSNYSLIKDSKFNLTYGSLGASGTVYSSTSDIYGGYYADCYYHEIYVYPFKNHPYGKIYGDPAYGDYYDNCDQTYYDIYWYWDAVDNADGYEIYKSDNYNNYAFDHYTTSLTTEFLEYSSGNWAYNGGFNGEIAPHESNQVGIYLSSGRNNSIQNVDSSYNSDAGVYLTGSHNNSMIGIKTRNNANYGVYLTGSHNNSMINLSINSNPYYGLYLTASHDNMISNSTSYLNDYGLYLTGSNYNNFTRFIANSSVTQDLYQSGTAANNNYFIDSIFKKYSIATASLFYFVNTSFGEIKFLSGITGTRNVLVGSTSADIIFSNNSIYILNVSGINKPANLTLFGLSTKMVNASIYKNGSLCATCYNFTSLNAGNVKFNITGAGNYSINYSYIDSVSPEVIINSPNSSTLTSSSVYFDFSINEEGNCSYTLNGGYSNYSTISNASNTRFTSSLEGLSEGIYVVNIFCYDWYGNVNASEGMTFTVDLPSGSSGSGGGYGGSYYYSINDNQLSKGYKNKLSENRGYKFNLFDENYLIKVNDIYSDKILFQISPGLISGILNLKEETKIDINKDGIYDLLVKVEDIKKIYTWLYIKKISEKVSIEFNNSSQDQNYSINHNEDVPIKTYEDPQEKNISVIVGIILSIMVFLVFSTIILVSVRILKSRFSK